MPFQVGDIVRFRPWDELIHMGRLERSGDINFGEFYLAAKFKPYAEAGINLYITNIGYHLNEELIRYEVSPDPEDVPYAFSGYCMIEKYFMEASSLPDIDIDTYNTLLEVVG